MQKRFDLVPTGSAMCKDRESHEKYSILSKE